MDNNIPFADVNMSFKGESFTESTLNEIFPFEIELSKLMNEYKILSVTASAKPSPSYKILSSISNDRFFKKFSPHTSI